MNNGAFFLYETFNFEFEKKSIVFGAIV